ncbi:MAG: MoaD/ThiS family protein [Limnohabitans sp.]|jgi:sulfur-carrier protein
MKIQLRFFASIREELGVSSEFWETRATDAQGLLAELRARGGAYASTLAEGRPVRVAINQVMAHGNTPLPEGAEVGLFPPVTGG